jgi:hypothetical protein
VSHPHLVSPTDPTELNSPAESRLEGGVDTPHQVASRMAVPAGWRVLYRPVDRTFQARGPTFASTGVEIHGRDEAEVVARITAYLAGAR